MGETLVKKNISSGAFMGLACLKFFFGLMNSVIPVSLSWLLPSCSILKLPSHTLDHIGSFKIAYKAN